jgi:hypothetical protein
MLTDSTESRLSSSGTIAFMAVHVTSTTPLASVVRKCMQTPLGKPSSTTLIVVLALSGTGTPVMRISNGRLFHMLARRGFRV